MVFIESLGSLWVDLSRPHMKRAAATRFSRVLLSTKMGESLGASVGDLVSINQEKQDLV